MRFEYRVSSSGRATPLDPVIVTSCFVNGQHDLLIAFQGGYQCFTVKLSSAIPSSEVAKNLLSVRLIDDPASIPPINVLFLLYGAFSMVKQTENVSRV